MDDYCEEFDEYLDLCPNCECSEELCDCEETVSEYGDWLYERWKDDQDYGKRK